MKKKLIFLSIAASVILFATSCKKDDTPATPTIVGFWKGKFGAGNANPTDPFAVLFRTDNTIRVYTNNTDTTLAAKSDGTYNSNAGVVTLVFSNNNFLASATVDANFTNMIGTVGLTPSTSNFGNFFMAKQ